MLSDTIKQRLRARFDEPLGDFHKRRVVFWRDEAGDFSGDVEGLDIPGATVVKLTGSNNFAIKKLLSADDPTGNYLVYDPLTYEKDQSDDWLLDIKLYSGEEFRADLVSLQMEELNIEPTSKMRHAVEFYEKFFKSEERKAKLKKIGRAYNDNPTQFHIDIMAVLCGLNGGSAQDILIAVLEAGLDKQNNHALADIEKHGNIETFWRLAEKYAGYENIGDRPLSELAAHILITAAAHTMGESALKGLEKYMSDSCRERCFQLVHEWQRGEKKDSLLGICREVEHGLRLANRFDNIEKIEMRDLLKCDVFPAINESILRRFFAEIGQQMPIRVDAILEAVENRRTSAWHGLTQSYFECLKYMALMQKYYLAHLDGFHLVEPRRLWDLYTADAYAMDSHYRHFYCAFGEAPEISGGLFDDHAVNAELKEALRKCLDTVDNLYHKWFLASLTEAWTKAIKGDLGEQGYVSVIPRQRDFYEDFVSHPDNKNSRVFVVISDALRFEVAAQLAETLNHGTKGRATLNAVQAMFPTVTKFGMAALLPGKEIAVNDKLDVLLDGRPTDDTKKREAILKAKNVNSAATTYRDLRLMGQQERRDLAKGMEVVYIYHNKIDAVGDKHNTEADVFKACKEAIGELLEIVNIILNDLSGATVYVTADHGFLYTYKPLEESQKISRQSLQGGDIYDLGHRHALVAPQTKNEHLLPVNIGREIGGKPILGYAPQETVRIKAPGGENYVHGGISLQEMAVPVIAYKGIRATSKKYVKVQNPGLELTGSSRKVSNLIFTLDFWQKLPIGDKVQSCEYTLQFVDDKGSQVSDTQTVIADKTSENASERTFKPRFSLKPIAFDRNKTYRLVISNKTDAPDEIDFCIDIAFADDFGFNL